LLYFYLTVAIPKVMLMNHSLIYGSIPALVTPMNADSSIAWESYTDLIEWHIQEGSHAICVVGTTGESPTVTVAEHCKLIDLAVQVAKKRIPIIAGAGGNSTAEAIELARSAKQSGADATLQVVPYYNKPTQEGLFQHFKAISEAVALPVILYNVPSRTVADLQQDTVVRLAQLPNIVGIKEATGDLGRGIALINAVPSDFSVLSGDDATAAALILMGGKGNISVSANIAPNLMSQLCEAALAGDVVKTRHLHAQGLALHQKLFIEANPIPVKWALNRMGKIPNGIRLPLTPLSQAAQILVEAALTEAKILKMLT
jgi:4-hydroxy-tetrahydrodipicolinate synthase